jgi:uncharacterized membrane protein
MTHRSALRWLVALAVVAIAIVALDVAGLPLGPLRVVAGSFLALVAPGAALLAAVGAPFLAGVARVVLAVPVSLGILALIGVVLDRTSAGVTPASTAVACGVVTGLLLAIAAVRELRRARREGAGGHRRRGRIAALLPIDAGDGI